MSQFMIAIPTGDKFEVGLADGIWPWKHMATCDHVEDANRICTLLAMHYRVQAHTVMPRQSEEG